MPPLSFRITFIAAATVCAVLFYLAVTHEWLRMVFYCEGFGCMGLGVLYLVLAAAIVLAFAVLGTVYGPMPRWSSAMFAGGVAAVAMLVAFAVIDQAQKNKNAIAFSKMQLDCAKNAGFCPLPDLLRSVPLQR